MLIAPPDQQDISSMLRQFSIRPSHEYCLPDTLSRAGPDAVTVNARPLCPVTAAELNLTKESRRRWCRSNRLIRRSRKKTSEDFSALATEYAAVRLATHCTAQP